MNVLYICHRVPYPPNKGEKIRSFHQIQYLSKRHKVHVACLADEQDDLRHAKQLESYCASVDVAYRNKTAARCLAALGLLADKPLSVAFFYSSELRRKIERRLRTEAIDIIVVCSSAMAPYVWHVRDIPKVIDFVDVDSEKWRLYAAYHPVPFSWLYQLEAKRLTRYEEVVARTFNCCIFISREEANLFQRRVNDRPIVVVSNGVDLKYFVPNRDKISSADEPSLLFTGVMDYFPNVDAVQFFCREIFPLVREMVPQARFYVVGKSPTRGVRSLGSLPGVIVTGSVPDVRPYLGRARVAVAPFRVARGVQNKVLEAMAMGLPVIGTSIAFQGIQATEGDGIRIANDPESFAKEVCMVLKGDKKLGSLWAGQTRGYVDRHHQWHDMGAKLELLLEEMTEQTLAERL
jgi:sugar transferase (PEP-CTERM/EpsH1 system associated)